MRDEPHPNSIEILGSEVREQLASQLVHLEAVDAKAGVVLGFAGLLVAVAPDTGPGWAAVSRLAGVVAAVLALLAFFPREYPLVDLTQLRRSKLGSQPDELRLALMDTSLMLLDHALFLDEYKSRRLRSSIVALVAAIILTFVGLVLGPTSGGMT